MRGRNRPGTGSLLNSRNIVLVALVLAVGLIMCYTLLSGDDTPKYHTYKQPSRPTQAFKKAPTSTFHFKNQKNKCNIIAGEPTEDGYLDNTLDSVERQFKIDLEKIREFNPWISRVDPHHNLASGIILRICPPAEEEEHQTKEEEEEKKPHGGRKKGDPVDGENDEAQPSMSTKKKPAKSSKEKSIEKKGGTEEEKPKKKTAAATTTSSPKPTAKPFPPGFDPRRAALAGQDEGGDPEGNEMVGNDHLVNNPDNQDHDDAKHKAEEEKKKKEAKAAIDHAAEARGGKDIVVAGGQKFKPNIYLDPELYGPMRRSWMVSKTEDHLCGKPIDKSDLPDYAKCVGVGKSGKKSRCPHAPDPPKDNSDRSRYEVSDDDLREATGSDDITWLDKSLDMLYVRRVFESIILAHKFPTAQDVIPVWIEPLFMDDEEMKKGLAGVDVPVRQYVFLWNSKHPAMAEALQPLRRIKYGLLIVENGENVGFANSLNTGIMRGLELVHNPSPTWFFTVNADVSFPQGSLNKIAYYGNKHGDGEYGLIYGFEIEHYAFGITMSAVRRVGLLDEVIWPAYMEDVDYHWRVRLCGLGHIVSGAHLNHVRSVNLRFKRGKEIDEFKAQHSRNAGGFAYGHNKWGGYHQGAIFSDGPPSGWRSPFGVPNFPLSLWAVDPIQRECVKSGKGVFRPHTHHCWYNGTILLEFLPPGTELPRKVLDPEPNHGYSQPDEKWKRPPVVPNTIGYTLPQPLPRSIDVIGSIAGGGDGAEAETKAEKEATPTPPTSPPPTLSPATFPPPKTRVSEVPFDTDPPQHFVPNIELDPAIYKDTRRSWMLLKTDDHLCGKPVNTDGLPKYLKHTGVGQPFYHDLDENPPEPPALTGPRAGYKVSDAELKEIVQDGDTSFLYEERNYYARIVAVSVVLGLKFPTAQDVIPVWIEPLFMDDEEMKKGLAGVDVPVRQYVFLWNSKHPAMAEALQPLRRITQGVHIVDNNKNVGFSTSLNTGILLGLQMVTNPHPAWFFAVNADVSFPEGSLGRMAYYGNKHGEGEYGLIYGFEQEHYAFGITLSSVRRVGLLDEAIWPAYMEDVDYRWRVRLCGLGQITVGAHLHHVRSVNLRFKGGQEIDLFRQQHARNAGGFAYGHSKWGAYGQEEITKDAPPSNWRTPWNIPNFPLSLWAVDPVQRECVNSGNGVFRPDTSTCWFNGTILLEYLPHGTQLPRKILEPEPESGYHAGDEEWPRPSFEPNKESNHKSEDPLPTNVHEFREKLAKHDLVAEKGNIWKVPGGVVKKMRLPPAGQGGDGHEHGQDAVGGNDFHLF